MLWISGFVRRNNCTCEKKKYYEIYTQFVPEKRNFIRVFDQIEKEVKKIKSEAEKVRKELGSGVKENSKNEKIYWKSKKKTKVSLLNNKNERKTKTQKNFFVVKREWEGGIRKIKFSHAINFRVWYSTRCEC